MDMAELMVVRTWLYDGLIASEVFATAVSRFNKEERSSLIQIRELDDLCPATALLK